MRRSYAPERALVSLITEPWCEGPKASRIQLVNLERDHESLSVDLRFV